MNNQQVSFLHSLNHGWIVAEAKQHGGDFSFCFSCHHISHPLLLAKGRLHSLPILIRPEYLAHLAIEA